MNKETKLFFNTERDEIKNQQQHRSILFCLSSHGFGHLTRTLAIIDRMLFLSNVRIFIMCGEKQIEFAKAYYEAQIISESHRINFIVFDTDIGLINQENTLQVDLPLMNLSIKNFIHRLEKDVNVLSKELQTRYIDKKISGIITDISIAASELVISKAGWETIAEAMIAGTPMVLMKRPEVLEDTWIIEHLEEMEKSISLIPEELAMIRINELKVAGSQYILQLYFCPIALMELTE